MKRKKTIVAITGGFYPYFSPGGNIVNNILQELKREFNVIVLAEKTEFGLEKNYHYEGIDVIRINNWNKMIHHWCALKIINTPKGIEHYFYKILLYLKRVIYFIYRLFHVRSISGILVKRMLLELRKIEEKTKIDILIPTSEPHESMATAVRYKKTTNHDVRIFSYQLDHFSDAKSVYEFDWIKKIKYPHNIKLEIDLLDLCEKHYILPPIYNHYNEVLYKKFSDKIIVTEHPLVKNYGIIPQEKKSEKEINLVYTGSLDIKLRNPRHLFEVLYHLKENKEIRFHLYSFGNCQSIINEYKSQMPQILFDYGKVSTKLAREALVQNDILVTIGNNIENETPSKLFEYLSMGKPIIHFYYYDTDAYISYLALYPHAICLKISNEMVEENANKLYEFCKQNKGKRLEYKDIEILYNKATPKYVSKQFYDNF